ncbi:MAG: preprotein translocase subunit YajC [Candidatus Coatesbacteria bacterium]|nr:MAG: preprotein translocase subunit YajC [Candidatus Coatesbacteria bacterium]
MLLFLATTAHAMGGTGGGEEGGGGGYSIFFLLLAFMVIFYLFVLRPQQRAEKKKKEMLGSVKKGWRVITAGGIRGTVAKVHDKEKILTVTIAKGVEVEVALAKIEAAAPPGEELAVAEPARRGEKAKDDKGPRRPRR